MVKRMLIDATHPEETRVVVINGTRLEELDVETSTKKQLKGNIYLAKVVRVEPSLQAAFVEYGGNRHGFLAFSEIHPDYFQIPVADRQALLAAQRADHFHETAEPGENGEGGDASDSARDGASDSPPAAQADSALGDNDSALGDNDSAPGDTDTGEGENGAADGESAPARSSVEMVGGDEAVEQELERRRARLLRNYKIQEVIKRRQILLIQVVKEERGNKGAALTTYLSLAGRYCVLMPNTARGGGVSRKIVNVVDRKRLKAIAQELEIPDGMAVIIRTAGSERSRTEIRRDYEYLLRMWDNVRELTLQSSAPALVYEEASLIKRSIRDLYSRDIDEVLVDGDEGYRLAKDYMRMLTPSHTKKVQPYKDPGMPLFHRFQVETQLDAMHSPVAQLRSGGYIVINQTEALVAIDVNSGRATRERHIEETALKTNLEAADEISRQLRLRDLAGLVVIDFIDMEEMRNNHAVERRLKEALKLDRARIQVGRISPFGLLELSRQRLRPSLQETSFVTCPHCGGTGLVRSVESAAMHILRAIEEEGIRRRSSEITVSVPTSIALYVLNQKREALSAIELRYQFRVFMIGDDSLIAPAFRMERIKAENVLPPRPEDAKIALPAPVAAPVDETPEPEDEDGETVAEEAAEATEAAPGGETGGDGGETAENGNAARKRRRRRRRKRRDGTAPELEFGATANDGADDATAEDGEEDGEEDTDTPEPQTERTDAPEPAAEADAETGEANTGAGSDDEDDEDRPKRRRRGRRGGRRQHHDADQHEEVVPVGPRVLTPDAVADVFAAAEAAEEAAEAARRAALRQQAAASTVQDEEPPLPLGDTSAFPSTTPVAADPIAMLAGEPAAPVTEAMPESAEPESLSVVAIVPDSGESAVPAPLLLVAAEATQAAVFTPEDVNAAPASEDVTAPAEPETPPEKPKRKPRAPRRKTVAQPDATTAEAPEAPVPEATEPSAEAAPEKPKRKPRAPRRKAATTEPTLPLPEIGEPVAAVSPPPPAETPVAEPVVVQPSAKSDTNPVAPPFEAMAPVAEPDSSAEVEPVADTAPEDADANSDKPRRRGWWSRPAKP